MVYKVCTSLNARLRKLIFILKAKKLYDNWLQQHADTPEEVKPRSFNQWIKEREQEHGRNTAARVPLRKPNKRCYISRDDCIVRVEDYSQKPHGIRDIIL